MNVLQISKFYWPVIGGIEAVTWELAEGLVRRGLQVDVLCSNQQWRTTRERFATGYDVVRAGSLGMLLSTSMSPAMLAQLFALTRGRDVLHVHMPDPMAALAILAVRPRGRVVVHWHSDVIRQRRSMALYEPLQSWLLQRADAIVATSQPYLEASQPLQRWRSKVTVIPIGISDRSTLASPDKVAAIRRRFEGRRIVFSLGRITYYKGLEVLLDAAARLPEDTVVLIGGEGELLEHFRSQVVAGGLERQVHFLGHVPNEDLPSYYQACDVFCMSSTVRAEAYGVAIVEAMMMGRPIVATDIPGSGVPWVNVPGLTGFNAPVGDADALALALLRLLGDASLRARLGAASRQRYLSEFDSEKMTSDTIDLYRRLLNSA